MDEKTPCFISPPPAPDTFPPTGLIAVGFGYAYLERDGETWYEEPSGYDIEEIEFMTGADAEEIAAADPDHDWRIILKAPLCGRVYQRQGKGLWVLIHRDRGFA